LKEYTKTVVFISFLQKQLFLYLSLEKNVVFIFSNTEEIGILTWSIIPETVVFISLKHRRNWNQLPFLMESSLMIRKRI